MTQSSQKSTIARIVSSAPRAALVIALLVLAGFAIRSYPAAAQGARALPAPAVDAPPGQAPSAVVVLAGGCFWGVQGVFQHVKGVTSAVSGYAGGDQNTAHYEVVTRGTTGHAESVQVTFDPRRVQLRTAAQIFFSVARSSGAQPTGPGYRNAVSLGHLPCERRPGGHQAHRTNSIRPRVQERNRHEDEAGRAFYPAEATIRDFTDARPCYIVFNDFAEDQESGNASSLTSRNPGARVQESARQLGLSTYYPGLPSHRARPAAGDQVSDLRRRVCATLR